MIKFKSKEIFLEKKSEDIFNKIIDLRNFKELIPSEVKNFVCDKDNCSFNYMHFPEIKLTVSEKIKFSRVSLKSTKGLVPFVMSCNINAKNNKSKVYLEVDAELNIIFKKIAEKSVNKLLNSLVNNIKNL